MASGNVHDFKKIANDQKKLENCTQSGELRVQGTKSQEDLEVMDQTYFNKVVGKRTSPQMVVKNGGFMETNRQIQVLDQT